MSTLFSQLRQACDEQHQALHAHPLLAPLDRGDITLDAYKRILAMFYAAYHQTESHKPLNELPDSPIMEWLEADMGTHAVQSLSWSNPAITLDSDSKLVGYLYVKQGSTLGGQYISKHLHETLGLGVMDNQFFSGYGDQTGAHWRQFKSRVEALNGALSHKEVIDTAKFTFGAIQACADRVWKESA